jgi:hypothetical protein
MPLLPNGYWVFFGNVPHEATELDLQLYLAQAGIDVGLDRISMKNSMEDHRASALVSLPASEVCALVERAVYGRKFKGRDLRITSPGVKKER